MKSKIYYLLFVVAFLNVIFTNAQVLPSGDSPDLYSMVDKTIIFKLNYDGNGQSKSVNNFLISNNSIHIKQVGFYNYSTIVVKSENYDLTVNQNGFNNYLDLYKNSVDLNQSVSQAGSNNFISDFSLSAGSYIDMSIYQEGNNLTLFNNGTNSISRDLKITQTGTSGTIYIFNN